MLENISINKKLPFVMIFFAILSMASASLAAYIHIKSNIETLIKNNMISLLEARRSSLYNYLDTLEKGVSFHGQSPIIKDALNKFVYTFKLFPEKDRIKYFQEQYITNNPFSSDQKGYFLSSGDNSSYDDYHKYFHPIFNNLVLSGNYQDMFLIDKSGNLVYSVRKDSDYATNLNHGPWKDSSLSKIFKSISKNPTSEDIKYSDFEHYGPSHNDPASFIGTPIFNVSNDYIGALIFQIPIEPIDKIMQVTAGMGETGESYIVGSDLLMRSNSRFFDNQNILKTKIDSIPVKSGLAGNSGEGLFLDYRGKNVYSAYTPIVFHDVHWVMISEIDQDEVFDPILKMGKIFLISNLVIVIFVILVGYFLGKSISNPIRTMTEVMLKLANNDLSINVFVNKREDEIGHMAKALSVFKENVKERDEFQKKLEYMAEHDNLTGLATRRSMMHQFELLMELSKDTENLIAIFFIDLDNFKKVNDTLGHDAGDKLLCNIANSLTNNVRKTDIVSRIGGDEFLVISPDMDSVDSIKRFVENLMLSTQSAIKQNHEISFVSLSVGVAVFPVDDSDINELIKKADKAMYVAKNNGKNNYCFWENTLS